MGSILFNRFKESEPSDGGIVRNSTSITMLRKPFADLSWSRESYQGRQHDRRRASNMLDRSTQPASKDRMSSVLQQARCEVRL